MSQQVIPLIDMDRVDHVTEIGLIAGGEWADVLAVSYGPHETLLRVRFEKTGERYEFSLPPDVS